jgi:lysophospholipase L1-like esterase
MKKKHLRWIIPLAVVLILALFAASFVNNMIKYQRQRPEKAVLNLVKFFNARTEWIKGSTFLQNSLRSYIHSTMNSDQPWPVNLYLAENKRPDYLVVAIGDSLTAGRRVDEQQRYVYFLEKLMAYHSPGKTVKVVNAGVPGNTIVEIRDRLDRDLIPLQPDLVVLGVGFNDSRIIAKVKDRYESIVPIETFKETYAGVIDTIRSNTKAKILVFSTTPVAQDFESALGYEYTEPQIQVFSKYIAASETVALHKNCAFADVHGRMVTDPAYKLSFLKDGLHVNTIGNLVVARYLFEAWLSMEGLEAKEPFLALVPKAIGRIHLLQSKVIHHGTFDDEKPLKKWKKWKEKQKQKKKAGPFPATD